MAGGKEGRQALAVPTLGPLAGGFIVDHFSWRWLFYINPPLDALALVVLLTNLDETVQRRERPLDYVGCTLLTTGVSALMLALLMGGTDYPSDSVLIIESVRRGSGLAHPLHLVGAQAF